MLLHICVCVPLPMYYIRTYLRENLYSPVFKGEVPFFSIKKMFGTTQSTVASWPQMNIGAHTYISWEHVKIRTVLSIPYLIIHFLLKNNRFGLQGWGKERRDGGKDRRREGERERGRGKGKREGGSEAGGGREGEREGADASVLSPWTAECPELVPQDFKQESQQVHTVY